MSEAMPTLKVANHQELVERVMTEHWDIGACPCTFCQQGRLLGCKPRYCYPTIPKVSILDDGSKKQTRPVYDWNVKP
jgi:hypothetical protein